MVTQPNMQCIPITHLTVQFTSKLSITDLRSMLELLDQWEHVSNNLQEISL
jgi:hypothetical protein